MGERPGTGGSGGNAFVECPAGGCDVAGAPARQRTLEAEPGRLEARPLWQARRPAATRMNPKRTWLWLGIALGLFAFIYFFERHIEKEETGPRSILPGFRAADIQRLQVLPRGQLAIYAERTNQSWRLTQPLVYPARSAAIDALLYVLEHLTSGTFIPMHEVTNLPNADEQYGFDPPQFSLALGQPQFHLLVGRRTAFGNQVFVQRVGADGIFVVDARLLELLPRTVDEWRETALVDWEHLAFDRFAVTNAGKVLELRINPETSRWRIIQPTATRADGEKVQEALARLTLLHARQFVSDDPEVDLDVFGLRSPEMSIAFFRGTNTLLSIDFGRSPTNDPTLAYARRGDRTNVVTVPKEAFEQWTAAKSDLFRSFFDRHLITLTERPDGIEIRMDETNGFTLQREGSEVWRVLPDDYLADTALMREFLTTLTNLQAAQIEREIAGEAALPEYGLAPPGARYILRTSGITESGTITNRVIAEIHFGIKDGKVFARRANEGFVFAMNAEDMNRLPFHRLQLRDRRVWRFSETNVARLIIRQGGRTRELIRRGPQNWVPGPGWEGIMDPVRSAAVEETVHRIGDLEAAVWVQRGTDNIEAYGFTEKDYAVTVELQNGEKRTVEFGHDAPSQFPFARVNLDGETWVFEFPWLTYQMMEVHLEPYRL